MTVTSDGSGFGAAWHLESIEVTGTNNSNVPVVFPCNEWLDPKDPMSLQKTLLPAGVTSSSFILQYTIKVYTSDLRGAGTDDDIAIQLWGDKSHTAPLKLDTTANNFERNMTDVFTPKAADVGEMQYIIVKKAGNMLQGSSFLGGDWHLQQVEVHHPGLKKTYFFFCNEWLKGNCEKKLMVGQGGSGHCRYKVVVFTAGESCDVSSRHDRLTHLHKTLNPKPRREGGRDRCQCQDGHVWRQRGHGGTKARHLCQCE